MNILTPDVLKRLSDDANAPVLKLETPKGPAEFVKYKDNPNKQNVLVKVFGRTPHWFKRGEVEATNEQEIIEHYKLNQ